MQLKAGEIAHILNGTVDGDSNVILSKIAKIEEGEPNALSFLANPKYEPFIYETQSSAVLVSKDYKPTKPLKTTLIRVVDPYAAFTKLLELVSQAQNQEFGIHATAFVHPNAKVADKVYVGPLAVIDEGATVGQNSRILSQAYVGKNVVLGEDSLIYPGVIINHHCIVGNRCIIHSGTVIGSDGFGFAPLPDRSYKKIPQTGNVIIENDVEIGANCAIDRATIGSTIIRNGVKLDNLVQIAHNVEVGEHTVIASQTGIAGSTKIGKYCIIAGQVGFVGHITIADGNTFAAQSGISNSVKTPNQKWFGSPAFDYGKALRTYSLYKNLPEMEKRLRELEQKISDLSVKDKSNK
jgi:UDP-3-O-[3-hydroxymyristoyl] glucosamine N-acyltransferase